MVHSYPQDQVVVGLTGGGVVVTIDRSVSVSGLVEVEERLVSNGR